MRNTTRRVTLAALALLGTAGPALAGGFWSFGVRIGVPVYPGPCCGYGFHCWRPYAVYVQPAPVIIQPAPVVQEVPVVQPVYRAAAPAPTVTPPPPAAVPNERQSDIQQNLQRLSDPDERVRAEAALQLGRLRAQRAVDPLAATLAGDASPAVREAAARGLGLIGSPRALPALRRAAQADSDRDVRHSAMFAIDVIQAR
ncbi:MAG TPA: HEAT repeat domain-containing protein [Gemmataceae bacterium]|jgi:hypothetical protein|nr:HEAT repeat domain-containing protein [Gemmataceae bacterium]